MLLPVIGLPILLSLALAIEKENADIEVSDIFKRIVNAPPAPPKIDPRLQPPKTYWDQDQWRRSRERILRGSDFDTFAPKVSFDQSLKESVEMADFSDIANRNHAILNDNYPSVPPYVSGVDSKLFELHKNIARAQEQFGRHQYAAKSQTQESEQATGASSQLTLESQVIPHTQQDDHLLWHAGMMSDFCLDKKGETVVFKGLFDDGNNVGYFLSNTCKGKVGQPINCPEIVLAISKCREQQNIVLLEIPWIADPETRANLANFLKTELRRLSAELQWPHFDGVFLGPKDIPDENRAEMIKTFLDLDGLNQHVGLLDTITNHRQLRGMSDGVEVMKYLKLLQPDQSERWFKSLSDFDSAEDLKIKADLLIPHGGIKEWNYGLGLDGLRMGRKEIPGEGLDDVFNAEIDDLNKSLLQEASEEIVDDGRHLLEPNDETETVDVTAATATDDQDTRISAEKLIEKIPSLTAIKDKEVVEDSVHTESAEEGISLTMNQHNDEPGEKEAVEVILRVGTAMIKDDSKEPVDGEVAEASIKFTAASNNERSKESLDKQISEMKSKVVATEHEENKDVLEDEVQGLGISAVSNDGEKEPRIAPQSQVLGEKTSAPVSRDDENNNSSKAKGLFAVSNTHEMIDKLGAGEFESSDGHSHVKVQFAADAPEEKFVQFGGKELPSHVLTVGSSNSTPTELNSIQSAALAGDTSIVEDITTSFYSGLHPKAGYQNHTVVTTTVTNCNKAGYCVDAVTVVVSSKEKSTAFGTSETSVANPDPTFNIDYENDHVDFEDDLATSYTTEQAVSPEKVSQHNEDKIPDSGPVVTLKETSQHENESKPSKTTGHVLLVEDILKFEEKQIPDNIENTRSISHYLSRAMVVPTVEDKFHNLHLQTSSASAAISSPLVKKLFASSNAAEPPLVGLQDTSSACRSPSPIRSAMVVITVAFLMATV